MKWAISIDITQCNDRMTHLWGFGIKRILLVIRPLYLLYWVYLTNDHDDNGREGGIPKVRLGTTVLYCVRYEYDYGEMESR